MIKLILIRVNGVARFVRLPIGVDGRARIRLAEICRIFGIPAGGCVCIGS